MDKTTILYSIISILLAISVVLALGKDMAKETELCMNNFGEKYNFALDRYPKYSYEYVNEDYYNCCWYEVELEDNRYIKKKKCIGFEKEGEE